MTRLKTLLPTLVLLGLAAPASAQSAGIGFRAFVFSDVTSMTASQSFDAVLGTSRFTLSGFGGEVTRIPAGLFVRVATTNTVTATGTRVLVFGDAAVPVDIPVTIEMRHTEFAAGWRVNDRPATRFVPYAGGGLVRLRYSETSDFAEPSDNTDETFGGYLVFGGVDVKIWKWLMAGAEVQFRTIPDAIGTAGASAAFEEDDLGSTTFRVMVGIRR